MSSKEHDSQIPLDAKELLALINAIENRQPSGEGYDKLFITGDQLIVDEDTEIKINPDFMVSFSGDTNIQLRVYFLDEFPKPVKKAVVEGYLNRFASLEMIADGAEEPILEDKPPMVYGRLPEFFFTFATASDVQGELHQCIIMYYLSHLNPKSIFELSQQAFENPEIRYAIYGS